jgi:hypothetical protein
LTTENPVQLRFRAEQLPHVVVIATMIGMDLLYDDAKTGLDDAFGPGEIAIRFLLPAGDFRIEAGDIPGALFALPSEVGESPRALFAHINKVRKRDLRIANSVTLVFAGIEIQIEVQHQHLLLHVGQKTASIRLLPRQETRQSITKRQSGKFTFSES